MSTIATPRTIPRATLADLAKTEGKAELIDGRIVHFMAAGIRPSRVASRIFRSLDDFAQTTGRGHAFNDNLGYAIPMLPSGRESFNPDASYFAGPCSETDMGFIDGPPRFAVEVRSENDYGLAGDAAIAAKRAEYFEAGTQIVWDVDPIANVIRSYTSASPDQPLVFKPSDQAHAEPAVPGWSLDAQQLFRP
jgi:Uma2 family endonuclease